MLSLSSSVDGERERGGCGGGGIGIVGGEYTCFNDILNNNANNYNHHQQQQQHSMTTATATTTTEEGRGEGGFICGCWRRCSCCRCRCRCRGGWRRNGRCCWRFVTSSSTASSSSSAAASSSYSSSSSSSSKYDSSSPTHHHHHHRRHRHPICKVKYLSIIITMLTVFTIPTLAYLAVHFNVLDLMSAAVYSASIFVALTVPLSMMEIINHWCHWYMPDVQKFVVRILFMVPLYSIQSFLSLIFHGQSILINTIRGLYEAFVISSFVYYLIELLGGEEHLANVVLKKKSPKFGRHWGLHWCGVRDWIMGEQFLFKCKHGVLQYVVLKTIATFTEVGLYVAGLIHDVDDDDNNDSSSNDDNTSTTTPTWYKSPTFYITFIMNISVSYALYCLVKIFYATRQELIHPINWKPAGKFACVKGVVFFTFWQSVLLYIFEKCGLFDNIINSYNNENGGGSGGGSNVSSSYVAGCLQDYLVCIEMLIFAIAHRYTFTYKEYITSSRNYRERRYSGGGAIDDGAGAGAGSGFMGAFDDEDNDIIEPLQQGSSGSNKCHNNERNSAAVPLLLAASSGGGGTGTSTTSKRSNLFDNNEQQQQQQQQDDDNDDNIDDEYQAPIIKQLYKPMHFTKAFWSSTVPNETLSDIRRLGMGTRNVTVEGDSDLINFVPDQAESI